MFDRKRAPIKLKLKHVHQSSKKLLKTISDSQNVTTTIRFIPHTELVNKTVSGVLGSLWIHIFSYLPQNDALLLATLSRELTYLIYFSRTHLDLSKYGRGSPYAVDNDELIFEYLRNFIKLETLRLHKRLCLPVRCEKIRSLVHLSNLTSVDLKQFNPDEAELHMMSVTLTNIAELWLTRVYPVMRNFGNLGILNLTGSTVPDPLECLTLSFVEKKKKFPS